MNKYDFVYFQNKNTIIYAPNHISTNKKKNPINKF